VKRYVFKPSYGDVKRKPNIAPSMLYHLAFFLLETSRE